MTRPGGVVLPPVALAFLVSAGAHGVALLTPLPSRAPRAPAATSPRQVRVELREERTPPEVTPPAPPRAEATRPPGGGDASPARRTAPPRSGAVPLDTPDPVYRDYFGHIRRMIAGVWHWPEAARSPGERGRVTVEFRLSPRGALEEVRVAVSSGSPHLDGAAVAAVTRAAPFPPRPAAIVRDPFLVSALFLYE